MIEFVKGALFELYPTHAVVDVGGMGYKVFISAGDYGKMPKKNGTITLYTSFIIRDNLQALYGFFAVQERDLFDLLITVSGIGPKTALALISNLDIAALQLAVHNNDTAAISRVPGIGKKTAERLIIDVRDKFSSINNICTAFSCATTSPASKAVEDAVSALTNLGYNQKAAEKAIKKTIANDGEDLALAKLITSSLKNI